jgi:hypothetical protein
MNKPKIAKPKKCKVCTFPFIPRSTTQKVCSPNCAIALNKINKAKAFDAETKRLKQTIKTRSDYVQDAQKAFNLYIRTRDIGCPCISCLRTEAEIEQAYILSNKTGGAWDCGHFLTVGGHIELRFNTLNAYRQCKSCNGGSGKYTAKNTTVSLQYEYNLRLKIGDEKVDYLKGPHEIKKYTIDQLVRIRKIFTLKTKWLKYVQSNTL